MKAQTGIISTFTTGASGAFRRICDPKGIKRDRSYSDQFLPEISQIVGPFLVTPAPLSIDRNEATDLITLKARSLDLAVRMRKSVPRGCENQFTLRSERISGKKSELNKILDGFGDLLFYGIESPINSGEIGSWFLIDLAAFRSHLIRNRAGIRMGTRKNPDGITSFVWFDIGSFVGDPPILVATSDAFKTVEGTVGTSNEKEQGKSMSNHPGIKNLKPFKPGESGNPGGRPKNPPGMDSIRKLTAEVLRETAELLLKCNWADLQKIKADPQATVLKRCLASVLIHGERTGDMAQIDRFFNRVVGKVPETFETASKKPGLLIIEDLDGKPMMAMGFNDENEKMDGLDKALEKYRESR